MRKLITSFFIAFLLLVTGTSVFGQVAGDFVVANSTAADTLWCRLGTWAVSNGAGATTAATRLPGANDNVFLPTGTKLTLPAAFTATGTVSISSAVVTLNAANVNIAVGMNVTGTFIDANTRVVGVSGTSVTLSKASTYTSNATPPVTTASTTLTFSYASTVVSSITSGSTTATLGETSEFIVPGMVVTTATGIPSGTTVVSISGNTVTLSAAATATNAAAPLAFTPSFTYKDMNVSGTLRSLYTLNFAGVFNVENGGLAITPALNCKSINVTGTFKPSGEVVADGDITVNAGGLLTIGSSFYCTNITNRGTFNATTGFGSSKALYVGFTGNKVPGIGDYTIVNDGTFGDTQARENQNNGSGIRLWYSNQCANFTVQTSSPSVTTYAFNIAAIAPHASLTTTANTTLHIKQSMSLLLSNGIGLSLQNNDPSASTTRTCIIYPGVTVYMAGKLHANGGMTSVAQGNFVYNIYGTLDMGTYTSSSSSANVNSMDLCLSATENNTSSLTINVGNGSDPSKLVIGSNIKIMKLSNHSVRFNFRDYSTVEFNNSIYSTNATTPVNTSFVTNYQLLNNNTPALYLFPNDFYNLKINGSTVVLPIIPRVRGSQTFVAGGYSDINWAANSTAVQGSVIFTGSKYYYAPVVRGMSTYQTNNPVTLTSVSDTTFNYIKINQVANGSGSGLTNLTVSAVDATSKTVTFSVAPSATSAQTDKFITFTGKSDPLSANIPTGTSTNTFYPVIDGTQTLIYLGGAEFAAAATITSVDKPLLMKERIFSNLAKQITIENATVGDIADVYSVSGMKVASAKLVAAKTNIYVNSGIYIVKINNAVAKVAVK